MPVFICTRPLFSHHMGSCLAFLTTCVFAIKGFHKDVFAQCVDAAKFCTTCGHTRQHLRRQSFYTPNSTHTQTHTSIPALYSIFSCTISIFTMRLHRREIFHNSASWSIISYIWCFIPLSFQKANSYLDQNDVHSFCGRHVGPTSQICASQIFPCYASSSLYLPLPTPFLGLGLEGTSDDKY